MHPAAPANREHRCVEVRHVAVEIQWSKKSSGSGGGGIAAVLRGLEAGLCGPYGWPSRLPVARPCAG